MKTCVKCFLFVLLVWTSTCAFGQKPVDNQLPYIRNQMSLSMSYSKVAFIPYRRMERLGMTGQLKGGNIQVMYGYSDWLELGVALDACYASHFWRPAEEGGYDVQLPTIQCYVGQEAKAHLFSAFWPEFSLIDLYAAGLIGVSATISTQSWPTRISPLVQIGAGAELNLSRHFGFYLEYGINHKADTYLLGGFNIRFGGPKKWQR